MAKTDAFCFKKVNRIRSPFFAFFIIVKGLETPNFDVLYLIFPGPIDNKRLLGDGAYMVVIKMIVGGKNKIRSNFWVWKPYFAWIKGVSNNRCFFSLHLKAGMA